MNTLSASFLSRAYNPLVQAAFIFGCTFAVILLSKFIHLIGVIEVGERFPWTSSAAFLLFFAMFNSISSLATQNLNAYWSKSVLAFAALVLANGLIAYLFSGLTIGEAGSYRWIFIVLTFGYLVFLSIVGFMKRIVEFAQREEWNQPRIRNRKNRRKE